MGNAHPNLVPYQTFATSDGELMLAVGNDKQFAACAECIGHPELALDKRFRQNRDRIHNRAALIAQLASIFEERTTGEWLQALAVSGVPAGPINDIQEVLSGMYAKERNLVRHLTNSQGQDIPAVANPVAFGSTPVEYAKSPPLLGEHTDEVLREWLGYSDELIAELRQSAAL
jgi:formyl-CoA transferase